MVDDEEENAEEAALSVERYAEMGAAEQFILTITDQGFGKPLSGGGSGRRLQSIQ